LAIGLGSGWPPIVFISSITMATAALLFFFFVEERPKGEYKLLIDADDVETHLKDGRNTLTRSQLTENLTAISQKSNKDGVGFFKAWTLENVAMYATSYALIKLIFYGMLMWLPYYVRSGLGKS
jgi:hypothetical protein